MQDFKGRFVLVPGGATEVGRAAASAFGRRGAVVVLAGRRQSEGDKAVAALSEIGARGRFIRTDVTKPMAQRGKGAIVVNTSVSGLRNPNPGLASKAALVSLTRSAAMESAENGVRINAVAPGRVVTDMMLASKIMDMSAVAAALPLRRMGRAPHRAGTGRSPPDSRASRVRERQIDPYVTETAGPNRPSGSGFQDRCLKPLGHLSVRVSQPLSGSGEQNKA